MANKKPFSYPRFQAFDSNGDPLSGGTAEFFDAGTTTNRDIFSDPELTTTLPNPIDLNSRGEPETGGGAATDIYFDDQPYKIVLKDSGGSTVWTIDKYVNAESSATIRDPDDATDQSTDVYEGTLTRDPSTNESFEVDFKSQNTTTTPTYENTDGTLGALTIKTRDGSALWAGAIDGPHWLEYDGTDFLLLDPNSDIQEQPATTTYLAGHIDGLELSNNATDSDHDLDIATGVCSMRDGSGNRKLFELTSSLTKQIDANWAEGTDAGGFPSGLTLSADTEYNVFLIGKDDGTVDAGFDTDASATNLLSDASSYLWFRRIGSVFTDGSSNIRAFEQRSDYFWFGTYIEDLNDSSGTLTTFETVALTVPAGFTAIISFFAAASSATDIRVFITGVEADTDASFQKAVGMVSADGIGTQDTTRVAGALLVSTDASSQIQYTIDSSNGTWNAIRIQTRGWIDDRGRNA